MPVPANLQSVTLSGDARSLLATWVPGDTTETGFKVRWSMNNGSTWGGWFIAPAGVTLAELHGPDQGVNAKVEVLPFNATGDAASSTVSTAVAVGVLPETANDTDVWLVIGESPANPHSINIASFTALGASKIVDSSRSGADNLLCVSQIKLFSDQASKWSWSLRNNPIGLPILNAKAYIWDHVGLRGTITSIAANTPTTGTTEVTFSDSIGRPNGHQFYARFTSTGVANMDNVELLVTVSATNKVQIASFTASSASSTGYMDLPSFNSYDEDVNAETDYRGIGFTPTRTWSLERALLARAQEDRDGTFGDGTNTTSLLQRIIYPASLVSRIVGSSSTTKRWSKERSGKSFSQFDVMTRLLTDAYRFAVNVGSASSPSPFNIKGIVLTAGYTEVASNVAQTLAQVGISSAVVGGGGTVTVTTSANHNCSDVASNLYTVARITGLGGTLGDALNGKHFPIHVTGATTFEIVDFDGTGLTGTVTSGQTVVLTGASIYFFAEVLRQHVEDVRAAAATAWGGTQAAADIPVVLVEPSMDVYLAALNEILTPGPQAAREIAYGQIRDSIRQVAGELDNVRAMSIEDLTHSKDDASGLLTGEYQISDDGTIRMGERAYEILTGQASGSVTRPTPCVLGVIIGDSYVNGSTPLAMSYIRNPELLDPAVSLPGGSGDPIPWLKVYNQSTEQIEQVLVDPTIDLSYLGRSNLSTNPVLNPGQTNRVGIQIAAARELRLAFPDNDIVLFDLGVDGSTAAQHVNSIGTLGARIKSITPGASSTTIELETGANGGNRIYRTKPINVVINGVTGLTPSIDGTRLATPIDFDNNPVTRGTQRFTIPIGTTGTPVVSSAYVKMPQGIWDPDANDLWSELEAQVPKMFDALKAANYIPDARFAFCLLGTNDAALNNVNGEITTATYSAAIARILAGLREQFSTRADPRDELGVVFLEPIKHGRATLPTSIIASFQAALKSAVSGDSRAATLNVDEQSDRLLDAVTIDADGIHPDTAGYVQLGYRLARKLAAIGTWDAPFDTSAGGSGESGSVEVVSV